MNSLGAADDEDGESFFEDNEDEMGSLAKDLAVPHRRLVRVRQVNWTRASVEGSPALECLDDGGGESVVRAACAEDPPTTNLPFIAF